MGQTRRLDKDAFHTVYSVNSASGKWPNPRVMAIDSPLRFSAVGDGGTSSRANASSGSVEVAGFDMTVFEIVDVGCFDTVGIVDCEGIVDRGLRLGFEVCFVCFGGRGTISRSSSEL